MSSRHVSRALLTRPIEYRCYIANATLSSLQADHLAAGTNDVVLFKEHVQLWGEVTEGLPQVDWFPFQTIHTRAGVPREANWQPVRMHFIYKGGKAEPVAWEVTAIALSVANFELPFPQESRLRIDFSGEEAQAQAFQWICRYVFSYHIPVDSTLPFWYEGGRLVAGKTDAELHVHLAKLQEIPDDSSSVYGSDWESGEEEIDDDVEPYSESYGEYGESLPRCACSSKRSKVAQARPIRRVAAR